jgi:hypothetical protein
MKLSDFTKNVVLVILIAGLFSGLQAQEKNDAIKVFNEGVELMKANDVRAIESFGVVSARVNRLRFCQY